MFILFPLLAAATYFGTLQQHQPQENPLAQGVNPNINPDAPIAVIYDSTVQDLRREQYVKNEIEHNQQPRRGMQGKKHSGKNKNRHGFTKNTPREWKTKANQ